MGTKIDTSPARGTRDVLPDEVELRDQARDVILATYRRFGYAHIETPALESMALLAGSQGGENAKLIYRILKRGKKLVLDKPGLTEDDVSDLGLRYDLTVPLARYYAQNHSQLPQPFKAIQVGSVWRAERPQKGRYRQFTQVDIDVLGEPGIVAEVDLLTATTAALSDLGLADFAVRINDRRILSALATTCGFDPSAHEAVFVALDKRDKVGWDGVATELVAAGHSADAVLALGARLDAMMSPDGGMQSDAGVDAGGAFATVAAIAATVAGQLGTTARVIFDPTLVRGMGYYTGTIFEIGVEGLPYSIAGGGRYDRMIGAMLGKDVPACGFSIGFERLILLLAERRQSGAQAPVARAGRVALLCPADGGGLPAAMQRAGELRHEGYRVSVLSARKKLGKQLSELEQHGFDGFVSLETGELRFFDEQGPGSGPDL
jgi:histidyl-tRNA synthetase